MVLDDAMTVMIMILMFSLNILIVTNNFKTIKPSKSSHRRMKEDKIVVEE